VRLADALSPIVPGSDLSIALLSFWTDMARGQPAILPDMKR
jgi:L-cysteine S-thiosulfotransferase